MLIEKIFDIIISIFTKVFSFVEIPKLDEDLVFSVTSFTSTLFEKGANFLDLLMPFSIAKTFVIIIIAIELIIGYYHLVMWILKKIPIISIS